MRLCRVKWGSCTLPGNSERINGVGTEWGRERVSRVSLGLKL